MDVKGELDQKNLRGEPAVPIKVLVGEGLKRLKNYVTAQKGQEGVKTLRFNGGGEKCIEETTQSPAC